MKELRNDESGEAREPGSRACRRGGRNPEPRDGHWPLGCAAPPC